MDATKLLVISFAIKYLARNQIFIYIREKYGLETIKLCRSWERLCIRKEKCKSDIEYLLTCRKERLIPKFAIPMLSLNKVPEKLKKQIAKLIVKAEIKNKHAIRKKILKDIRKVNKQIQDRTSFLLLIFL